MAGRGMAKVALIGNLGKDPEMRFSASGMEMTKFSLACGRVSKGPNGEQVEETDWFNITAFGNLGKICQDYLKKGSKVYLEGRLQLRQYDDQATGQKRTSVDVVVSDVQLIDSRQQQGGGQGDADDSDYAPQPQAQPQRQQGNSRPNQQAAPPQQRRNQPAPASNFDDDVDDIPF